MNVGPVELTYCTNIHAGETLTQVLDHLTTHVSKVRDLVCPDQAFGVGLRLSAEAAAELARPERMQTLRQVLADHQLYVFTLNGFPYGPFHGRAVKTAVYQPDWTQSERSSYTTRLVEVLSQLLPSGMRGSISTLPGGFGPELDAPGPRARIAEALIEQVVVLDRVLRERGQELTLALEPEPCCLLETTDQTIRFFEDELCSPSALDCLARRLGVGKTEAELSLRRHLGVCLDTCHQAVEFEEARHTIRRLTGAGLRIAKLQASTGLALQEPSAATLAALGAYAEPVYLHQVVLRTADDELVRFLDLPDALASEQAARAREWRVHFHVPIFRTETTGFSNTQAYLAEALALERAAPFTEHIEVETYTWDVLPASERALGLHASIARELEWVRERLAP